MGPSPTPPCSTPPPTQREEDWISLQGSSQLLGEDHTLCPGILVLAWIMGRGYISSCRRMGRISRSHITPLAMALITMYWSKVAVLWWCILLWGILCNCTGMVLVIYITPPSVS